MKKLIAILILMVSISAQADLSVTLDGSNHVTGFEGFEFQGTMYKVILEYLANPATDPGDSEDIFVPEALLAHPNTTAAATALASAITALASNPMLAHDPLGPTILDQNPAANFVIPYLYGTGASECDGTCVVRVRNISGGLWLPNDGTVDVGSSVIFAKFQPTAAVPVPPAVLLFGSGMLALVGVARRRKGGTQTL